MIWRAELGLYLHHPELHTTSVQKGELEKSFASDPRKHFTLQSRYLLYIHASLRGRGIEVKSCVGQSLPGGSGWAEAAGVGVAKRLGLGGQAFGLRLTIIHVLMILSLITCSHVLHVCSDKTAIITPRSSQNNAASCTPSRLRVLQQHLMLVDCPIGM